jgi:uncharacterized membrane protein
VAVYGVVLFGAAVAYAILTRSLTAHHGLNSELASAVGNDFKGWISIACYLAAILLAFAAPLLSCALYVVVAALWLVPDSRIEKRVAAACRKMEEESSPVAS